jgi:hypothetical protein
VIEAFPHVDNAVRRMELRQGCLVTAWTAVTPCQPVLCVVVQDNLRYEGEVLTDKLIKLRSTRQDLEAELFSLKDKRIKLLETIKHLEDEEMQLVGEVGAAALMRHSQAGLYHSSAQNNHNALPVSKHLMCWRHIC